MPNIQTFIQTYSPLAQDISSATGLAPELVLGQVAQETGWGQHVLGNNIFGISPGGKVKPYGSVSDAANAYVNLVNNPRFQKAGTESGYQAQAQELSNAGYGPDKGYGSKIAAATNMVLQAGYKPPGAKQGTGAGTNVTDDPDADVEQGQALYQKMTGSSASPIPQEPKNNTVIDVSNDPEVDDGKAIFQKLTGTDPEAIANTASPSTQSGSSASSPEQLGQHFSSGEAPGIGQQFFAGAKQGVNDVANTVGGAFSKLTQFGDQNPTLAAIDKATGLYETPEQAAQKNALMQQDTNQYEQQYGSSIPAMAGRIVGNTAMTAPMLGPIGKAGLAGGEALTGMVTSPLAKTAIKAATTIGTGAAQGTAGASLTGADPVTGAVVGGAVPALGNALQGSSRALSNTLQSGGLAANALNSKIADKLVHILASGAGLHYGDLGGMLIGYKIAPIIKDISTRYGPVMAKRAADAIEKTNSGVLKSGIPGALGSSVPGSSSPAPLGTTQ